MCHKNFKNDLIIYLLGTAMVCCVAAHPIPGDQKLLDNDQLEYLSYTVCSNLEYYLTETTVEDCIKNFTSPTISSSLRPATAIIRCQRDTSITVQLPKSNHWQLVMLLPEKTDQNVNAYDIETGLLDPEKEFVKITTMPKNYTLWNTELRDGVPLQWVGGEKLPKFKRSSHREYNVSLYISYKSEQVKAYFKWNTSGDGDVCFDVQDSCADTKNKNEILPNEKPEVLLKLLKLNRSCEFSVTGMYGTTVYKYSSPPCRDAATCESDMLKLRNPQKIDLMRSEADDDTWTVRVNWTRPVIPPIQYNLTLCTKEENITLTAPGTALEAVFTGVVAEGEFHVSMYTILDSSTHTSVRGYLPPHSVRVERRGGVGAGGAAALCAGAAAAALLAALCWRRRHAHQAAHACYLPEEKLPTDGDVESMGLESEAVEDHWEVRSDRLLLHEVVGEGAFGVVRRGTLAPGGKAVAVKMLKDFPSLEEIRAFRSEMELMKSVGVHPHIVSLVGCCSGRKPLIIAEYCSRGDLLSYLRCSWDVIVSKRNAKYYNNNIDSSDYRNDLLKCSIQSENSKLVVNKLYDLQGVCDKELTASDLLSFCRQIAMGMEFLASNRVVHRDLAARNILVTSDKTLKIADFGLSRDVYEENQYKQKGNGKMPVKWMALESLTRRIYTTQSDVWSFGIVVWEIVTLGGSPYSELPAARLVRLLRAGYRMPCPANCSAQLYEVMSSCWRAQPRERPTFAELHVQLDALLAGASADQYLSLELDADAPPTPKPQRYISMLLRGKRTWPRGESYERPLKRPQSNHYSSPPVVLTRAQPI